MLSETAVAWLLFAYSLAVGGGICVFYDALNLVLDTVFPQKDGHSASKRRLFGNEKQIEEIIFQPRKGISARDVILFFTDILFFSVSGIALVVLIMHFNNGKIRMFSLLSALIGFAVYKKTLSHPLTSLAKRVLAVIFKALTFVTEPITAPIKRILGRVKGARIDKKRRKTLLRVITAMETSERKREMQRSTARRN